MKKTVHTRFFRRKKAMLTKKIKEVSKDLNKLARHINGL